jgi:hypothetical protein
VGSYKLLVFTEIEVVKTSPGGKRMMEELLTVTK